jgi:hypothetical protein
MAEIPYTSIFDWLTAAQTFRQNRAPVQYKPLPSRTAFAFEDASGNVHFVDQAGVRKKGMTGIPSDQQVALTAKESRKRLIEEGIS